MRLSIEVLQGIVEELNERQDGCSYIILQDLHEPRKRSRFTAQIIGSELGKNLFCETSKLVRALRVAETQVELIKGSDSYIIASINGVFAEEIVRLVNWQ